MPLIQWDEELVLGNKIIDEHHQHLVNLLNNAHDAFMYGMKQGKLKLMVAELLDYTGYHFAAEEEMMKKCQYPGLEQHAREHVAFCQKARELEASHTSDNLPAYLEITDFLLEWVIAHIKNSDRKIFEFCAEASKTKP